MSTRSLSPGTVVHNRYRIERVLGEGGFGVTYMVTDTKEDRIAAMKEYMPADIAYRRTGGVEVLPRQGSKEPFERFRDRFLEEARIIYRYRGHPNITDVRHLFYDNNTAYYVMEYINGMDLSKYLERNGQRLSWDVLRPIVGQVITALREVHRSGMIHCDISPDNIFILDGGQVKLIDFGAAKSVLHGKSSIMLLKRGFAPPEQLSAHGKLGPWTDIYALAVTIYRAYTGRMPPTAEDRLMDDRTTWPSQLGLATPFPAWEGVLRKAMSLRLEDRYQDVDSFWADLSGNHAAGGGFQSQQSFGTGPALLGLRGVYEGTRIQIRGEMLLGTDRSRCQIAYPPNSPGVSRVHLRIWAENSQILVMDMGSTYGSWLGNMRMSPGMVYILSPGATVYLGDGQIFGNPDTETAWTR